MEIDSIDKLIEAENRIQLRIQQYKLDEVLVGLRKASDKLPPFVVGGISLFAVRYCTAGHRTKTAHPLDWSSLAPLADLVTHYLIADPLGFDPDIQQDFYSSNPVFTMLRIAGNQMPYAVNLFGQYVRPLMLFHEIPNKLKGRDDLSQFDFEANFLKLNGVPPLEFIKVGFMAFVAARNNIGFTRGYFEAARSQGLNLPKDKVVSRILDNIAANPKQLTNLYRKFKVSDPRFAMYDLNPLLIYPIVRPWKQKKGVSMEQDRMIAPLPDLIAFRISMGIFYQMFNFHLTDFSNYFGYVFEAYVGQLFQESVLAKKILSEDDIRKTYSSNQGKVPDWVIIDGTTAILIECKATRFSRAALTTGTEEAIDDSLKQVIKGFRQLHRFTEACKAKVPGLEVLHGCTTFKPILITLEPLYMINSELFQNHINERLATEENITELPWLILAVEELERLQPHLAAGVGLNTVLDDLRGRPFNTVLEEIHSQTNLTYKDSFLYKKEQELYSQLGYGAET